MEDLASESRGSRESFHSCDLCDSLAYPDFRLFTKHVIGSEVEEPNEARHLWTVGQSRRSAIDMAGRATGFFDFVTLRSE